MQPNVITLNVDENRDGALTANVDYLYERFDTFNSRSIFNGPSHLPDSRETLSLYRTPAKANGNFRGTQKSSFKFTTDIEVAGVDGTTTIVSPIIFEVSASIPLGATSAQVLLEQQRIVAALNHTSFSGDLNEFLSI